MRDSYQFGREHNPKRSQPNQPQKKLSLLFSVPLPLALNVVS